MIHEVDSTTSLLSLIELLWAKHDAYQMVYTSIGGKFNDDRVPFSEGTSRTNALQQMMPHFLFSDTQRALIIVLDRFENPELYEKNKKKIASTMTELMDVVILDGYCTQEFLENFVSSMVALCKQHQFPAQNMMICNFVKHMNMPNRMEKAAEEMIPKAVQHVLEHPENIEYSGCFYEWFGYRFYTYQFIYNYKMCRKMFLNYQNISDLEMFVKARSCGKEIPIQEIQSSKYWTGIYDICSYNDPSSTTMAMNLRDYLLLWDGDDQ